MDVLVIMGCCLKQNSSANLCHRAYIEGMINAGHTVDLLCFSEEGIPVDKGISMPAVRNMYEYNGLSLYEKLAHKRNEETSVDSNNTEKADSLQKISLRARIFDFAKTLFRKSYGIYNPSIAWYRRAKKFKSENHYDCVLSLAYPPVSHLLSGYLTRKKKIRCDKWIQLWEDPWTIDLCNGDNKKKCKKAEAKLLRSAEYVYYVSPITLQKQQELFRESAGKMKWCPVPTYYSGNNTENNGKNCYGYFGDYSHAIRNLRNFYKAALQNNVDVTICGSSDAPYKSENDVKVYPRLPLNELKVHEDRTNIVVCVLNLHGGQIPGKVYQYAATNKKIMIILDGTEEEQNILENYFKKFNRYILCHNTVEDISKTILALENGNDFGISNEPIYDFAAEKIVNKILNLED